MFYHKHHLMFYHQFRSLDFFSFIAVFHIETQCLYFQVSRFKIHINTASFTIENQKNPQPKTFPFTTTTDNNSYSRTRADFKSSTFPTEETHYALPGTHYPIRPKRTQKSHSAPFDLPRSAPASRVLSGDPAAIGFQVNGLSCN